MNKTNLCDSLVLWLQTCKVDGPCDSAESLADGVAMAQVLHQIAPRYFHEAWMSKVKRDVSNNWRLKVNNLKKIMKGITEYLKEHEEVGQRIQNFQMPDVTLIGEHDDKAELGRLLQLILGCAVNCDNKEVYIQKIMYMEEHVQTDVMMAIQELMTKGSSPPSSDSDVRDELKVIKEELHRVVQQGEEITQRCHELDLQVASLQEEKASLLSETEHLNERLTQADTLEDPSTPLGRRYQQLQSQVEQQHAEIYKLEGVRDDMKIKNEVQEKEIYELQQKNEDLSKLAEESRQMKDELDILRHTSDKVTKYEQTIESYKKKLEELGDLKSQVKVLEEKNTGYMQSNMDLEEGVRKAQTYKGQLDVYKRQVQELQLKTTEETKRADKAEFESRRHQEKFTTTQREKDRLAEEVRELKDLNEELQCRQSSQDRLLNDHELGATDDMALLTLPPEIKERILRLQHENKLLKLQKPVTTEDELVILQTDLEDAKARNSELESEVRILNHRVMELNASIEDLQESQTATQKNSTSSNEMRQVVTELRNKNEKLEMDLGRKKQTIDDHSAKLIGKEQDVKELQETLKKRDEIMKAMEEKYKKYLDKARNIIKVLEPKNKPALDGDLQVLKNQLSDRDKLIEHIEREHDKTKQIRDQEEKLIVSAWYNLGMLVNRKGVDERLTNGSANQSFLARQRQAHTRRTPAAQSPHNPGSR